MRTFLREDMMFKKEYLATAALFPMVGISAVLSAAIVYRSIFPRYERPDYDFVPGEYLYARISDRLPRREMFFMPHDHYLKGYFYPTKRDLGTVVFRHGIHSGADDYLPLIEALVRRGYSVFTYDATGTFESEGKSTVGMCQAIIDLEATVRYLRGQGEFKDSRLYLLGHSWGAYAVAAALCRLDGIAAVAAISGMNNGVDMISYKVREYVKIKPASILMESVLRSYQRMLFGGYVDLCAVDGINRAKIPTLIAHGADDCVIPLDRQSISSRSSDLIGNRVEYYLGEGLVGGHNSIWHSPAAVAYQTEVEGELDMIKKAFGGRVNTEKAASIYSSIDHRKYSAVNEELLDRITATFRVGK